MALLLRGETGFGQLADDAIAERRRRFPIVTRAVERVEKALGKVTVREAVPARGKMLFHFRHAFGSQFVIQIVPKLPQSTVAVDRTDRGSHRQLALGG